MQVVEVARDADADDRHDRDVLQQQVPPDAPTDDLTEHGVAVGVGRPGPRDQPGELRIRESRCSTGDSGDQKREDDGRADALTALGAAGDAACEREDPGADDPTDADRGQLPQPERSLQTTTLVLADDVVDRFAAEDARRRGRGQVGCRHGWRG
jgi:hypothetical protein